MNQIEKALSDYLGAMCGMRLKPHALTGLAKAAIAAMRGEPVGWMYERPNGAWPQLGGRRVVTDKRWLPDQTWTETALYAGPHPPASGKD